MTARVAWGGGALLGEGPVWDVAAGALWFVDIKRRHVHRHDPAGGTTRTWAAPEQVGWVLPADDGALIAGLQSGLARFDPRSDRFDLFAEIEPDLPHNRLNDATVAPDGTVWFGTMDDREIDASGRLYRWDGDAVTAIDVPPVRITNGPAVSPDGRVLYYVDTVGGVIHAVDIDGATFGPAREWVRVDPADGHPDGVTVDSRGNVWVGLWGGWGARLYAPDGRVLNDVRLPTANVTKVALGGAALDVAYATTASIGLDDAARAGQPDAGAVYAFDVAVPGQRLSLARTPR